MKSNMGLLMNIVLGMVGAAVADAILSAFGIVLGGWLGYLIAGFIGSGLGNLSADNSVLRRVPHLELAARNFRGGDNFKVGDWHEVPDFQFARAHNRQGRRLHSANTDYSPRASAQDDGRGTG
jgi:hypothetical protein